MLVLCHPPTPLALRADRVGGHGESPSRQPVPVSTSLWSAWLSPTRPLHSRGERVHWLARLAPLLPRASEAASGASSAALSGRPSDPNRPHLIGLRANENSTPAHFLHRPSLSPQCCPPTSRQNLRLASRARCAARRSNPAHFRIFSAAGLIPRQSDSHY